MPDEDIQSFKVTMMVN